MILYPAIDLVKGKAVRLFKGDYDQMTVYSDHPEEIAKDFKNCGCTHMHMVDLEGARDGNTPNLETILKVKKETGLFIEVGGGIRSMDVIDAYLTNGIDRVILGSAAVTDPDLLKSAVEKYAEKIAVGVDIKDGMTAIHGWKENSSYKAEDFIEKLVSYGVKTIIVTDISKDGAMKGTNRELYASLSKRFPLDIIASGGVSSLEDIEALRKMDIHGAIIGKAYYTKAIDLKKALEVSQ